MISPQFAVTLVPDLTPVIWRNDSYLNHFVPTTAHDQWSLHVWRESNTGDPIAMALVVKCVFAFTKSIPHHGSTIARPRHNLATICAKRNAQNITSVTSKASSSLASGQIPKAKGFIPRAGNGELTIRWHHNIAYKMVVAVESMLGNANIICERNKLPDDKCLV